MPWIFDRWDHYVDDGEGVEQPSGDVIAREKYPSLYRPMFIPTKSKIMKWIEEDNNAAPIRSFHGHD